VSALNSANLYNALKLHFNDDKYDFFKYKGKTRIRQIPNHHLEMFGILNNRYGEKLQDFYIANFLIDSKVWIGDLLSNECDSNYKEWNKKINNLTYIYKNNIIELMDEVTDLNELLYVNDDYPLLLKRVLQEKVSLESLLITNSILKFFPMWNKNIKDDIIWPHFRKKCVKYFPFLSFDKDKMTEILKIEAKKHV